MKNLLKREVGFTLVELMVVVAIIGLLSAVAVPNFKKYQAKAKIAEAKLQLAAVYTAEASFFSDNNMYSSCLRYMGYDPELEKSNRYYAIGFPENVNSVNASAFAAAVNSGLNSSGCNGTGTVADGATTTDTNASYFLAGKGIGSAIMNDVTEMANNDAGTAAAGCDAATIEPASTPGTCVGTQANSDNMTFQASAVGYISESNSTSNTASSLNINHLKMLKSIINGY